MLFYLFHFDISVFNIVPESVLRAADVPPKLQCTLAKGICHMK